MTVSSVASNLDNENQSLVNKNLQIEIDAEDLYNLISQKQLSASQVKCLNLNTKLTLWTLILKSCFR